MPLVTLLHLCRGASHPDVVRRLTPPLECAASRLRDAFECYVLPSYPAQDATRD